MANLLVRNVEDEVVNALKARCGTHGISAEEEHRRILRAALLGPRKKDLTDALSAIPNVGRDEDFERVQAETVKNVFD